MKLEVGMYVRTNEGIGTIHKLSRGKIYNVKFNKGHIKRWVSILKEPSFNIMDMIEEGDYVNGYKVSFKGDDYQPFVQCDYPVEEGSTNHYRFYEKAIYSIVTKEQFESMSYKVGDEK